MCFFLVDVYVRLCRLALQFVIVFLHQHPTCIFGNSNAMSPIAVTGILL